MEASGFCTSTGMAALSMAKFSATLRVCVDVFDLIYLRLIETKGPGLTRLSGGSNAVQAQTSVGSVETQVRSCVAGGSVWAPSIPSLGTTTRLGPPPRSSAAPLMSP